MKLGRNGTLSEEYNMSISKNHHSEQEILEKSQEDEVNINYSQLEKPQTPFSATS